MGHSLAAEAVSGLWYNVKLMAQSEPLPAGLTQRGRRLDRASCKVGHLPCSGLSGPVGLFSS